MMSSRLVLACLLVAALGIFGVAPVVAQDDSGSAEADASGEEVMTTEEAESLLAKVRGVAEATLRGDVAPPPLRVVTVTRFGNQTEDLPQEFDLPSFELEGRAEVASNRNVRYLLSLAPSSEDRELTERQQLAYETVVDLPRAIIADGVFYWSTSLTHLQHWPPDTPDWLELSLDPDIYEQSSVDRFINIMTLNATIEEYIANIPGTDRFTLDIINAIDAVGTISVVGKSDVRGHETTHLVLDLPTLQVAASYTNMVNELLAVFDLLGYHLPEPTPAFAERFFSPDYRVNIEAWIDSNGLIHRVSTDVSEVFVDYFTGPFAEVIGELSGSEKEALLEAVRGNFEYTISTDLIFLDEDPVIERPPASEVLAVDSVDRYIEEVVRPYNEALQDEDTADDGGLADTGANTPLLVLVGLSVVMAGALVFGLSRRLHRT